MYYVCVPTVFMRKEPHEESEVVSEALFSECVSLQKKDQDWCYIISPDQYGGWIPEKALAFCREKYDPSFRTSRLASHLFKEKDVAFGPMMTLPYNVGLYCLEEGDPRWLKVLLPNKKEAYIQRGDVLSEPKITTKKELCLFSERFLGLPYTWGGRSSFGYDCSGFVQMLYKKVGVDLQRDSSQQILDDRFHDKLVEEIEPCDLIFFGQSSKEVSHVGMYLDHGYFIHAVAAEYKPWIRISFLADPEWNGSIRPYRKIKSPGKFLGTFS
jgi:gamma-D-glutamyl-L-lysine dipeptidyl-peptidase